jgi:hypothetical protein
MLSGTADPVLPYEGGSSRRGDMLWPAERVVRFIRDLNGSTEPSGKSVMVGARPQLIEIEHSARCRRGAVLFYRVVGGGQSLENTQLNCSAYAYKPGGLGMKYGWARRLSYARPWSDEILIGVGREPPPTQPTRTEVSCAARTPQRCPSPLLIAM